MADPTPKPDLQQTDRDRQLFAMMQQGFESIATALAAAKTPADQEIKAKGGIPEIMLGLLEALKGDQGEQGDQGEAGAKGETGATGPDGKEGAVGPIGHMPLYRWNGTSLAFETSAGIYGPSTDLQGPRGLTGPKGDQGRKGDKGVQGEQGPIGRAPRHEWSGTQIRFEHAPGIWGNWHDLRGPASGNPGWHGGHLATRFSELLDVNPDLKNNAGKQVVVNAQGDGLTFGTGTGSSLTTLEASEIPNGNINTFTFLGATVQPNFILIDGAMTRAVSRSGVVNWTWNMGAKQATLATYPAEDVLAVI